MFEPSDARKNQIAFSYWPESDDQREETLTVKFNPDYTNRQYMCSFALKGRMYLVGGYDSWDPTIEYRQFVVSEDRKSMVELDSLPFEMKNGACVTYSEDYALLCASYSDPVGCERFDGEKYQRTGLLNRNHYTGRMASFKNGAVIVAGYKKRLLLSVSYSGYSFFSFDYM